MPDLRLEGATKYYKVEKKKLLAVEDINLTIEQGEFVFLIGSSGAGKTTVLRMLGGDLKPDAGSAYLGETNMSHFFWASAISVAAQLWLCLAGTSAAAQAYHI